MNREEYLTRATELLAPRFVEIEKPLPKVHVSVGFPSKLALSRRKTRIGECWHASASPDGQCHIFITPLLIKPVDVLDTLVHELVHVVTPGAGHKAPFVKVCNQLGLTEGKPTSRGAGAEMRQVLERLNDEIGGYPHPGLNPSFTDRKKQSTRMIKVSCPECDYTCRTTRSWLELGAPICPIDQVAMEAAA